jgi:GNAT superfamily N-acetyltransferase
MVRLSFRLASRDDIGALVDLVHSAYRGEASRVGWTTEADLLDGQRTDTDGLSEILAAPDSLIVVAEQDGRLVACAHLRKHDAASCAFGMFSVHPTLQGRGVGDAVLRECERLAKDRLRCTRIDMRVIAQRMELIPWYLRRGYTDTGTRHPFPYGDARFGLPKRDDLVFVVLAKDLR